MENKATKFISYEENKIKMCWTTTYYALVIYMVAIKSQLYEN